MNLTAYIHLSCPNSVKMLHILEELNIINYTKVIDVGKEPFLAYQNGILSVPVLFHDNNIIVSGTLDENWLMKYLSLYSVEEPEDDLIFRNYLFSILDNVATASFIYLYENHKAVLQNKSYIMATAGFNRIITKDIDSFISKILDVAEKKFPEFIQEKSILFQKAISLNFLREIFWVKKNKISIEQFNQIHSKESLALWLFSRASLGRIAIKKDITEEFLMQKSNTIWAYILNNYDEIWSKVLLTS